MVGGSKGVGAALVREVAKRGSRVTVLARDSEALHEVCRDVGGAPVPVDLTDLESLDGLMVDIEDAHGAIDILVSSAAITSGGPLRKMSSTSLRNGVLTNFLSHMELNRQLVGPMIARNRGTLAFVGSVAAEVSMIHMAAYAAAKAGLTKFALEMQRELRPTAIRVPVFVLGSIPDTQLNSNLSEDPVVARLNKMTGSVGSLTPEAVAKQMATVLAGNRRSAVYSLPWTLAPIVQFRLLPQRIIDPLLVRPALKEAERLRLLEDPVEAGPTATPHGSGFRASWF
ncbi:SDR family NAD(P)-dependent oxidoreductase [Mycolicibacterium hodleri]|uniref:SDR family NAD(P)-dependent oxidoreductase n=1 Tax=Mycolicibacterium hodleri TaxID=49897 RepID=UPI00137589C1|nr:SDR family oxidoreductase [Mycolicibacterium hodleri]